MQESADDLVKLYKRVSLDDDLDDQLRSQLLSQLSAGATSTLSTLRLVSTMLLHHKDRMIVAGLYVDVPNSY